MNELQLNLVVVIKNTLYLSLKSISGSRLSPNNFLNYTRGVDYENKHPKFEQSKHARPYANLLCKPSQLITNEFYLAFTVPIVALENI